MKGIWIVFLASFLNSEGGIKGCTANQSLLEFFLNAGPDPFEYSFLPVLAVDCLFLCSWSSVSVSFLIFDSTFVGRPESLYQGLVTWWYFQLQVLSFLYKCSHFFPFRLPLTCSLLFTVCFLYFLPFILSPNSWEKGHRWEESQGYVVSASSSKAREGLYFEWWVFFSFLLETDTLGSTETSAGSYSITLVTQQSGYKDISCVKILLFKRMFHFVVIISWAFLEL